MKRFAPILSPTIAMTSALGIACAVAAALSDDPWDAVSWLVAGPVRNPLAFGNLIEETARLTLAGIAAALAFRAGSFNLGGEGQALAGGLAAAAAAILFPGLPGIAAILLSVAAGIAAGSVVGGLSGMMKARWNVDELISTFLISATAVPAGQVLLGGPMKDPDSYLIAAPALPQAYRLAAWIPPSRLGPATIWALLASAGAFLFFTFSRRGYEWRLRGANESFAKYGGLRTGGIATASLAASGALYGLAGTAALLDGGQAVQGFTAGLGWNGLAVALIAAARPEFVPLAAFLYAWLDAGTKAAMTHTGFPFSLAGIVQAVVFLLVTAHFGRRSAGGRRRNAVRRRSGGKS